MHRTPWIILIVGAAVGLLALGGCASTGPSAPPIAEAPEETPTPPPVADGAGTLYAAATSDVDPAVTRAIKDTLELAKAAWGVDWNLDYYVIGADKAAAQTFLETTYCPRGVEQGRYADTAQCLRFNPKEKVDEGPGAPRHVGLMEYYQYSIDPGGSAARVGLAPMHVFFHSLPTGLTNEDPNGFPTPPADEDLKTVLHELWHAVQVEQTGEIDEVVLQPKMGPVWFVEGSAEYMGQRLRHRLRTAGTLPDDVGNTATPYSFRAAMERIATGIQNDASCSDERLTDFVEYGGACGGFGIDLGTWAMAYMHSLPGVADDAMTKTLNPAVADDGWQKAFETTVGMTLAEFETQFHDTFLATSVEDQLATVFGD